MAPKRKAAKTDDAEDAGVDAVDPPKKDQSKVPGGKAGGAASGEESSHIWCTFFSVWHDARPPSDSKTSQ